MTRRPPCGPLLLLVSVLTAGASEPTVQVQTPESRPATRPAAPDTVALSATLYPDDVTDQARFASYLSERTDALIDAARQAPDQRARIERHLAVANWILARQIEPQITRLLLGNDEPRDNQAVAASVAQAQEWLTTAGELLAALPADSAATQPASDNGQPEQQVGRVHRPDTSSSVMSGLRTRPTGQGRRRVGQSGRSIHEAR